MMYRNIVIFMICMMVVGVAIAVNFKLPECDYCNDYITGSGTTVDDVRICDRCTSMFWEAAKASMRDSRWYDEYRRGRYDDELGKRFVLIVKSRVQSKIHKLAR